MKVFVARTSEDSVAAFGEAIKLIKKLPNTKVYLIGEFGYDWELVDRHDLDGLVKPPKELKALIDTKQL